MAFRYVPPEKVVSCSTHKPYSVKMYFLKQMFQMQTRRRLEWGFFSSPSFRDPKVRRSFDECEDSVEVIAWGIVSSPFRRKRFQDLEALI